MLAWLCGIVLFSAVLFGGGTHAGFFGDAAVQLLSIPLLAFSLWGALDAEKTDGHKQRLIFAVCCAVAAVLAIQLIPLPFRFTSIGDAAAAGAGELDLLVPKSAWATISVSPQATWAAAASLIVPAAVFIAAAQLTSRQRLRLTWLLLLLGAIALLLGFMQMVQGPFSAFRFYHVTNLTETVGFFANRNHFAAHLYVTLVLGAVWFLATANKVLKTHTFRSRSIVWLTAASVFLVAVVAGLAMARSRAGLFLAAAALIGIVLMALKQNYQDEGRSRRGRVTSSRIAIVIVLCAVFFSVQYGLGGIASRYSKDFSDSRLALAQTTFETALAALPFGTGLGSFIPVYATVEKDADIISGDANRAHNDLAEFLLETGVFGGLFLAVSFVWFSRRAYQVWKTTARDRDSQLMLQRASTLVIALLLLHSLVDYPLRTTALSAIFAFFCAVLGTEAVAESEPIEPRRRSSRVPRLEPLVTSSERWGSDVQWPESWQKRGV
jgi:O-antigen ligase